jgi:hypothetical protein
MYAETTSVEGTRLCAAVRRIVSMKCGLPLWDEMGPGRFFGGKTNSSWRCRFLNASRTCCLSSSPETAP